MLTEARPQLPQPRSVPVSGAPRAEQEEAVAVGTVDRPPLRLSHSGGCKVQDQCGALLTTGPLHGRLPMSLLCSCLWPVSPTVPHLSLLAGGSGRAGQERCEALARGLGWGSYPPSVGGVSLKRALGLPRPGGQWALGHKAQRHGHWGPGPP